MKRMATGLKHLCILVLLVSVTSGDYVSSYDALSGVSHDSLLRTGLLLYPHTEHSGVQSVFPSLRFSCSGTIRKLFLVGRAGSGSMAPVFTLWYQQGTTPTNTLNPPLLKYSVPLTGLREVQSNPMTNIVLYEQVLETEREYSAGDMFGFTQLTANSNSVVLQYQDGGGEMSLFKNLSSNIGLFLPHSMLPLVAIETSNPECSSGFLKKEALEMVVHDHLAILHSLTSTNPGEELHLFPDMRFTCEGTITRLTVGMDVTEEGLSAVPEVQLWRLQEGSNDTYTRVESTRLSLNSMQEVPLQPGVYSLETSKAVRRGDILGVFYPPGRNVQLHSLTDYGSTVFSQKVGPLSPDTFQQDIGLLLNERQWPMVAVDTDDSSCVQGFVSRDLLVLLEQKRTLSFIPTESFRTYVVPELKFTTSGLLKKWFFVTERGSFLKYKYPHFQVWRATDLGFTPVSGTATLSSPTASQFGHLNVYEYVVDPPAPVMPGDFIGWDQPDVATARLLPYLLNNTGYQTHQATKILSDNIIMGTTILDYRSIPLISVELLVNQSVMTATITPTVSPTMSDDNESNGFQSLIGTILGSGLVGLLILLGLVIMMLFVLWAIQRHRKKQEKKSAAAASERDMDNPLYTLPGGSNSAESKYQELHNSTSEKPPTTLPRTPVIRHQESAEYAEPSFLTRRPPPPPVAPKPGKNSHWPPPSPLANSGPLYHVLLPQDTSSLPSPRSSPLPSPRGSPRSSPRISPLFPPVYPSPFSPSSEGPLSSVGQRSSMSPFGSLDRRRILHSREPSNVSEYDVIQPPHWEDTGNSLRALSKVSSHTGGRSRASSQATTCDDEPIEHMYQELEPDTGYSRLYREGIYVPTEEQRQIVATTCSRQRINIYAALSECLESPESPNETERMFFEESEVYWRPARDSTGLYDQLAQRKYREIVRHQIKIQHPLGSGHFGEVSKGEWQSGRGPVEVAVKTLKRGSSEEDTVKFLQEAAIMGQFRHPNIVQLIGIVTLREPVMIVLELLAVGDLRNHLLTLRPLTPGESLPEDTPSRLLGFCRDVASGMEYLARKAFVHRDLAARNILVAEDNTCKIGDFGMARDLEDENYYISRGGKIPIRWSPPEALNYKKYSTASDVWSFGIVMYEIWSLGHKPYEGYTNPQTQSLVERGDRLPPPPGCPRAIYSLMINCWHPEHWSRPTFLSLLKTLSVSATTAGGELLSWSERDSCRVLAQATALGAPLEAGRNLYPELQNAYT